LEKAPAELQSEIYRELVDRLMEHGRLRLEAMVIRDTKAGNGGVTEADWLRINELLNESWRSLARAVKTWKFGVPPSGGLNQNQNRL